MHIRPSTPADFPALQHIEVRAGELFVEIGMPEIAAHPPGDLAEFAAAEALLVAVGDDHQPVGYAWIELVDDTTSLEQLSVLPDHGAQGVGTALIDAVVAWARGRGDAAVTLTTFREVPFNAPIYAKRGFVEVPETEWSDATRRLVAAETAHGLDPAQRVVMRRTIS